MLTGQTIICISSIDWDFIWQGHQEIMSTLAARGPSRAVRREHRRARARAAAICRALRQRMRNWWRGTKGFREERPNLFVYSPLVLPLPYSRLARWINRLLLVRALRALDARHRASRGRSSGRSCRRRSRSTLIAAIDPALTIYYCIDDLASSSPGARRIVAERAAAVQARPTWSSSPRRSCASAPPRFSQHVHLFPFGVSFERFERARHAATASRRSRRRCRGRSSATSAACTSGSIRS